ncbi:MAG: NUDIX hydrolase [Candidatus Omnitrophica bacterium]|nr:NUDIX hydrolase [Candidatus Omnitrophota bacterium]
MMHRSFRVTKKKVIFSKGPIHLVDCMVRMPDGRLLSRQILKHPGSVVIIPRLRLNRYVLIRQFRFATGTWLWEFPAGGVEPGESLRSAACRELREEIGYASRRLVKLVDFYPTPGVSGERMHLFLAEKLYPAPRRGDEDEVIVKHVFSGRAIAQMIRERRIVDAKTIAGFLYLQYFAK